MVTQKYHLVGHFYNFLGYMLKKRRISPVNSAINNSHFSPISDNNLVSNPQFNLKFHR